LSRSGALFVDQEKRAPGRLAREIALHIILEKLSHTTNAK